MVNVLAPASPFLSIQQPGTIYMSGIITTISAREILDSRGNPTVEAEVTLSGGIIGRGAAPSGASTGSHEAWELRDNDRNRFHGKGVSAAVDNVNQVIAPALVGANVLDQLALDTSLIGLDDSPRKKRMGANAVLAVSIAAAKAACQYCDLPLWRYLGGVGSRIVPVPMLNILNGGAHADNGVDVQEFMIMPIGLPTFSDSLRAGSEIFHSLKNILKERNMTSGVGDEGGFAPRLEHNENALELLVAAIEKAGYIPGTEIGIALDIAASELCRPVPCSKPEKSRQTRSSLPPPKKNFAYSFEGKTLTAGEFVEILADWVERFPIISIEDGCAEDDWDGWRLLTEALAGRIQLVGDDLFVTNTERIQMGIEQGIANAVLIKPNQIGTVSETLLAVDLAQRNGYEAIVSHRSGETDDSFIADLAVATNCGQIKAGAPARGERTAKYNQLLRIESELGENAIYAGEFWESEES